MSQEISATYLASPPTIENGKKTGLLVSANGSLKTDAAVTGTVGTTAPVGGVYTDRSIANLSGASEQLMAANTNRKILFIYNIGASAVGVNLTGGAASLTVGGSVNLAAGATLSLSDYPPTGIITIIGTLNADVTAYEG